MAADVIFAPEASQDIDAAYDWCESEPARSLHLPPILVSYN